MTIREIPPRTSHSHELYGDFWFNSEPVPISALHGRVILLEFWDYTCVNCQRTFPYIKEWHKRYEQYGLVVVGVHTPKFPFEKDPQEIQSVIRKFGLKYPVVMDNEGMISARYGARAWPTMYLIDKDGYIRYESIGEGNYAAIEHEIRALLYDAGVREEMPVVMEAVRDSDKPGAICYRVTPELFAGYSKGSIGNIEGYSPESVVEYLDPKLYIPGRFYAEGNWLNDKNSLRLSDAEGRGGQLILTYEALEVNAIIKPEAESGFEVEVRQDDAFLTRLNKGDDVRIEEDGRSYFVVDRPRMFNLVKNKEYGEHTLRLAVGSNSFAVYSFTFVSSVIPELISNN